MHYFRIQVIKLSKIYAQCLDGFSQEIYLEKCGQNIKLSSTLLTVHLLDSSAHLIVFSRILRCILVYSPFHIMSRH